MANKPTRSQAVASQPATSQQHRIRRRRGQVREQLHQLAASGAGLEDLKEAQEEYALLARLTQEAETRTRQAALLSSIFVLLLIAGLLQLFRQGTVRLSVQGTVDTLIVTTSPSSTTVLEGVSVDSISVKTSASGGTWCKGSPAEESQCEHEVEDLLVARVVLHPESRLGISWEENCVHFDIIRGGLTSQFTFTDNEKLFGYDSKDSRLTQGDGLSLCDLPKRLLTVPRPRELVLGGQSDWGVATYLPSLEKGVVSLPTISREHTLFPTEALLVDGLSDASLTILAEDSLAVFVSGKATQVVTKIEGVKVRDLKPTLLQLAIHSTPVQGFLALIAGLVGAVLTISDRLKKLGY